MKRIRCRIGVRLPRREVASAIGGDPADGPRAADRPPLVLGQAIPIGDCQPGLVGAPEVGTTPWRVGSMIPPPCGIGMQRRPEPELMDDAEQASQYAAADFSSSDRDLLDTILAELAAVPLIPERVLDLGCGPGNISVLLAGAMPSTPVLAIDGAQAMLRLAIHRQRQQPGQWPCLHFHLARLPLPPSALDGVPPSHRPPFSLLVSNSLLHHLEDPAVLWKDLRRWASPGAMVLMRDLRRPDSAAQQAALVRHYAGEAPALLRRDFEHSLAAAYRPEEVESQLRAAGLPELQVRERHDRYLEVCGILG